MILVSICRHTLGYAAIRYAIAMSLLMPDAIDTPRHMLLVLHVCPLLPIVVYASDACCCRCFARTLRCVCRAAAVSLRRAPHAQATMLMLLRAFDARRAPARAQQARAARATTTLMRTMRAAPPVMMLRVARVYVEDA